MNMPANYQRRIEAILGRPFNPEWPQLKFEYHSVVEARLCLSQINLMQQQLRLVRKDALMEKERIRLAHGATGAWQPIGYRAILEHDREAAHERRGFWPSRPHHLEASEAGPYQYVDVMVNLLLAELERIRMQILSWLRLNQ